MTFNNDSPDASQPTSPLPPISTQKKERSGDTTSISHTFNSQRPPRPLRYPPALLRSRMPLFLSLGIALVLIVIVGMTVTVFSRPGLTSVTQTPTTSKTLMPAPTPTSTRTAIPTATPSPTPTPTSAPASIPTTAPTQAPTATPLVLPTTQTYVQCNPNSLTTGTAQLATFGGDVADNCGGQFFYNSLPTSMQEHYILSLSLPAGEAVDHCNIYGFIPSIHTSAQNMRADLFVNKVWLGWGAINQNSPKGWQDMGLTYSIQATGQVTIDVQVSDSADQSGELAWPTMKFACRMVST